MTHAAQKQQKQNSSGDSLFGMALAQAFTACVFGPAADLAWEAAEISSAMYEDRTKAKQKPAFALGAKNSLIDFFNGVDRKTVAEREQMAFRPSYAPSFAPGLALAA